MITNGHGSDLLNDNELVIREDGDIIESERIPCTSTVHVTPAAALHVKTFVSSTSSAEHNGNGPIQNGKTVDDDFEKNFLRAVDRALGVAKKDQNHLLQPIYDIPKMTEESDMNLVAMTERALSSFNNIKIFTVNCRFVEKEKEIIFLFNFHFRMKNKKMVRYQIELLHSYWKTLMYRLHLFHCNL